MSALQGLLQEDYSTTAETMLLDNAWRGAEVQCVMLYLKQNTGTACEVSSCCVYRHTTFFCWLKDSSMEGDLKQV